MHLINVLINPCGCFVRAKQPYRIMNNRSNPFSQLMAWMTACELKVIGDDADGPDWECNGDDTARIARLSFFIESLNNRTGNR